MFRVVVQDARRTPTSGKVVARLGSYDPHAKTVILDKEKTAFYLGHGAQPSDSIVRLLKKEGVKLPKWVEKPAEKKRTVRNPDKRRSTAPEKPAEKTKEPAEAEAEKPEEPTKAEKTAGKTSEKKPADETANDSQDGPKNE